MYQEAGLEEFNEEDIKSSVYYIDTEINNMFEAYEKLKEIFKDIKNKNDLEEIKHERFNKLKELVESQIEENNQKYVGTIQKVLVEGPSKNNPELFFKYGQKEIAGWKY